jgi:hypothetical protein
LSIAQLERWNEFKKDVFVEPATVEIKGKAVTRPLLIQYTVNG